MRSFKLANMNATYSCYNQFAQLYENLQNINFEEIEIKLEGWFGANMSAVLGGILDSKSATNGFTITSSKPDIISILQKNSFLANYGYRTIADINKTTIQYLKLKSKESLFFNSYVMNELLNRSMFPNMTPLLKKKIAESIYEIFVNAQMHSNSEYIYTCGQFYPKKHEIEFTIVDTGQGFKNSINSRFNTTLNSLQAIKWAINNGNTTKRDVSGGLGLSILKDFIKMNKGKVQIISDNGFYEINDTEYERELSYLFPGSIINMKFKTNDTKSYLLAEEIDANDIF